jgi:hypothetical protein
MGQASITLDYGTATEREIPVTLIGRKLLLQRCIEEAEDGIVLDDWSRDTTGWYEIIGVSDDCIHFKPEHIGSFVWLPKVGIGESYHIGRLRQSGAPTDASPERIVRERWFEKKGGPPLAVFSKPENT